jgi:hypothetical protein
LSKKDLRFEHYPDRLLELKPGCYKQKCSNDYHDNLHVVCPKIPLVVWGNKKEGITHIQTGKKSVEVG